ncbi:hypothetical protein [Saccharopolyspora dendranthemae]|uniref:Uncharacterized protein n=1 Tax=Saccharopolyspora dendranthemae TaxID=1181886 RepID=A0A561U1Y3_9PSEU|nr:hypothetical protein [Saccharopolyspora dendranthemae]TWF93368.1 hypothetical protein FHU35_15212 [Saccharopolyspora dendranthemae]
MHSHNYDAFASDLHEQHDIEVYASFGAELANCEAELSEFEQDAVRSYWDQVIAEELGELPVAPFVWSELGAGERTRLRRYERREAGAVLRLVTTDADSGEAA